MDKSEIEKAAKQYAQKEKNWLPGDFSLRFPEPDEEVKGVIVVDLVHNDDRHPVEKGGGKSIRLQIDAKTGKVLNEIHFQ
jgi:hypothetical protein